MQLDMFGPRQGRLHRSADAVDLGIVEHDGGSLRDGRQSHHTGTGLAPVHRHRRLPARIGECGRGGEFRDQQFRIVDLRHHQDLAEPCGDRRLRRGLPRGLRLERHAGAGAADLEAEREARYGSACARW